MRRVEEIEAAIEDLPPGDDVRPGTSRAILRQTGMKEADRDPKVFSNH